MSRMNLDPLLTLPDGSQLVISTQSLKDGEFSCALYTATQHATDDAAFRMLSSHLAAGTCLAAQEHAYHYALRIYPNAVEILKKPPYLIWRGPQPDIQQ